ncbi:hypothetical protein EHS13_31690 [Paenibacillus psychroresistens]|uniref:Lipoprotein n=1 Tax=Paenibacillus psychroresistens TaxID=1778678 RepID=A0A6B8RVF1_9BACL|nr:hypothetical protein [Paenibacillus psychroresistens]QGQ99118.1 hypothetical protein EHS13_31690 [Paenibacillus psychroresistens]
MKRLFIIAFAVALCLMAGCSSSPSSTRYTKIEEQTIKPSEIPNESPLQTEKPQTDIQADSASIAPTQQIEEIKEIEEKLPEKTSAPTIKPTKSQTIQAAKKSNESIGKAVTSSIMDKSTKQATQKAPEADQLKKSIEQIRALIKDLKQLAETNDSTKMKSVSLQIVQNWEGMKADVAASYPDMVDFLQDKIVLLNELQSGEIIDPKVMLQLDYELYQAFRQLADKIG